MSLITWSDRYSVNYEIIDLQHKKLISIINTLHDSMKSGKGKDAIEKTLDELLKYTAEHFKAEENMMVKNNYASYNDHKKIHDALTAEVLKFISNYKSGNSLLTMDIMQFLNNWLVNHILSEDRKYMGKL